ncbi:MAG: CinA family protein [Thermoplasmatales archaeon]|nr:MAG: CinA family protein [Thermoplasmatales archaeon]
MPVLDRQLLNKISDKLKKHHLSVAIAESCTGGLLAHTLTNISGSSEYFDRGIVSYNNQAKVELLGVPEETLKQYGAVSEQTARAMAIGIKERSNVDIGISTTGIAGPTGGTKEKPVGLVYIGIASLKNVEVKKFIFSGDRMQNKESTCNAALEMLLKSL